MGDAKLPRTKSTRSSRRRWLIRLAAILAGLLPLAGIELGARLFGPAGSAATIDPYVDLHQLRPLFQLDNDSQVYEIGPERMHLFRPASFSVAKPERVFRVFALGGSTTQGEPYSTETAFPKWLEIRLQAMMPSRSVEVINCGGLSYASYRVLAICREVLAHEPDLIVVYTGQNEFLEKRSYADVADSGLLASAVRFGVDNLRTLQLIQSAVRGTAERPTSASATKMAAEVDALLDYEGGLEDYSRSDDWQAAVVSHYAWNVSQIANACKAAETPVVFVVPTTNVLDCPPMKFESAPGLDEPSLREFTEHWETAKEHTASGQPAKAMQRLSEALRLDPHHAGCLFLQGRLLFETQQYEQALKYLTLARDHDVCPLRATSEIIAALKRTLRGRSVTVVDAESLFADQSPGGLVGDKWLVDHIHPSVAGHQMLGDLIADNLLADGVVVEEVSEDAWLSAQQLARQQHLAGLGEEYYHRGKQRLRGLQLWTQGRAKKIRSEQTDQ